MGPIGGEKAPAISAEPPTPAVRRVHRTAPTTEPVQKQPVAAPKIQSAKSPGAVVKPAQAKSTPATGTKPAPQTNVTSAAPASKATNSPIKLRSEKSVDSSAPVVDPRVNESVTTGVEAPHSINTSKQADPLKDSAVKIQQEPNSNKMATADKNASTTATPRQDARKDSAKSAAKVAGAKAVVDSAKQDDTEKPKIDRVDPGIPSAAKFGKREDALPPQPPDNNNNNNQSPSDKMISLPLINVNNKNPIHNYNSIGNDDGGGDDPDPNSRYGNSKSVSLPFRNELNPPQRPYPKKVFFIVGNEFCERFSYYGLRTVLVLYLKQVLGLSDKDSTLAFHLFAALCYFTPILGAILGDTVWGKFKTIVRLSIIYLAGEIILLIGSIYWDSSGVCYACTGIGLLLIGVGTGGIKPCVSALGGDQFYESEGSRRETFFSVFYGAINIGSLLSTFLTPLLRSQFQCVGRTDCFPLAFALPCILMFISIIVIVVARDQFYASAMPEKNVMVSFMQCVYLAAKRKLTGHKQDGGRARKSASSESVAAGRLGLASRSDISVNSAKGGGNTESSLVAMGQPKYQSSDLSQFTADSEEKLLDDRDHWLYLASDQCDSKSIEDFRAVLGILTLMIPLPLYWTLYDQQGSMWTLQAARMNGQISTSPSITIQPDQMSFLNSLLVIAGIPLFQFLIYPVFARCNLLTTSIQRIAVGGILAGVAFIMCGLVEIGIQSQLPPLEPAAGHANLLLVNGLSDCSLHNASISNCIPLLIANETIASTNTTGAPLSRNKRSLDDATFAGQPSDRLYAELLGDMDPLSSKHLSVPSTLSQSYQLKFNLGTSPDLAQSGCGCQFDPRVEHDLNLEPLADQSSKLLYLEQGNGRVSYRMFEETLELPPAGKARVRLLYASFGSIQIAEKRVFYLVRVDSDDESCEKKHSVPDSDGNEQQNRRIHLQHQNEVYKPRFEEFPYRNLELDPSSELESRMLASEGDAELNNLDIPETMQRPTPSSRPVQKLDMPIYRRKIEPYMHRDRYDQTRFPDTDVNRTGPETRLYNESEDLPTQQRNLNPETEQVHNKTELVPQQNTTQNTEHENVTVTPELGQEQTRLPTNTPPYTLEPKSEPNDDTRKQNQEQNKTQAYVPDDNQETNSLGSNLLVREPTLKNSTDLSDNSRDLKRENVLRPGPQSHNQMHERKPNYQNDQLSREYTPEQHLPHPDQGVQPRRVLYRDRSLGPDSYPLDRNQKLEAQHYRSYRGREPQPHSYLPETDRELRPQPKLSQHLDGREANSPDSNQRQEPRWDLSDYGRKPQLDSTDTSRDAHITPRNLDYKPESDLPRYYQKNRSDLDSLHPYEEPSVYSNLAHRNQDPNGQEGESWMRYPDQRSKYGLTPSRAHYYQRGREHQPNYLPRGYRSQLDTMPSQDPGYRQRMYLPAENRKYEPGSDLGEPGRAEMNSADYVPKYKPLSSQSYNNPELRFLVGTDPMRNQSYYGTRPNMSHYREDEFMPRTYPLRSNVLASPESYPRDHDRRDYLARPYLPVGNGEDGLMQRERYYRKPDYSFRDPNRFDQDPVYVPESGWTSKPESNLTGESEKKQMLPVPVNQTTTPRPKQVTPKKIEEERPQSTTSQPIPDRKLELPADKDEQKPQQDHQPEIERASEPEQDSTERKGESKPMMQVPEANREAERKMDLPDRRYYEHLPQDSAYMHKMREYDPRLYDTRSAMLGDKPQLDAVRSYPNDEQRSRLSAYGREGEPLQSYRPYHRREYESELNPMISKDGHEPRVLESSDLNRNYRPQAPVDFAPRSITPQLGRDRELKPSQLPYRDQESDASSYLPNLYGAEEYYPRPDASYALPNDEPKSDFNERTLELTPESYLPDQNQENDTGSYLPNLYGEEAYYPRSYSSYAQPDDEPKFGSPERTQELTPKSQLPDRDQERKPQIRVVYRALDSGYQYNKARLINNKQEPMGRAVDTPRYRQQVEPAPQPSNPVDLPLEDLHERKLEFQPVVRDGPVFVSEYLDVDVPPSGGHFQLKTDDGQVLKIDPIGDEQSIYLKPGTRNLLLLNQMNATNAEVKNELLQDNDYRISILYQIPAIVTITISEIMFSITTMEFCYSMAPESMKSIILAAWCLTVAIGNLLTVLIESLHPFTNLSTGFFFYSVLMVLDMLVFGLLGHYYKPRKVYVEI